MQSAIYILQSQNRVLRLAKECRWRTLDDINAESLIRWRSRARTNASHNAFNKAEAKHEAMGPRTQNHYLQTAQRFLNWTIRRGRWGENPLRQVDKVDEYADVRRERRPLTAAEVGRLMAVIEPEYQLVYEFALRTGLRRGETRALRWADLHLDARSPYVEVRAAITMNRRTDHLPLRSDLAERLAAARDDAEDGDRVFNCVPTVKRHRLFLKAAGIPYLGALGRRIDWHAMRTTFGTMLSTAGIAPRIAMELMRHSDLRLTMKVYTDAKVLDLSGAIEKLPDIAAATVYLMRQVGIQSFQTVLLPRHTPAEIKQLNHMMAALLSAQDATTWQQRGVVTSSVTFARAFGGALGVGLLGALFNLLMAPHLVAMKAAQITPADLLDGHRLKAIPPSVLHPAQQAIAHCLLWVFASMLLFAAVQVLVSLAISRHKSTHRLTASEAIESAV